MNTWLRLKTVFFAAFGGYLFLSGLSNVFFVKTVSLGLEAVMLSVGLVCLVLACVLTDRLWMT